MANPRGRPKTSTMRFYLWLPVHILPLLLAGRPELFKPGQPGVFKHGAWSSYIAKLIMRDLRDKETLDAETTDEDAT